MGLVTFYIWQSWLRGSSDLCRLLNSTRVETMLTHLTTREVLTPLNIVSLHIICCHVVFKGGIWNPVTFDYLEMTSFWQAPSSREHWCPLVEMSSSTSSNRSRFDILMKTYKENTHLGHIAWPRLAVMRVLQLTPKKQAGGRKRNRKQTNKRLLQTEFVRCISYHITSAPNMASDFHLWALWTWWLAW